MAAAVSATSTLRLASPCCGAGSCGDFGGAAVMAVALGNMVPDCSGREVLLVASVSASGFATGWGTCVTVADGVLVVSAL